MILYELKKYFDKKNAVTSGEFLQEGFEKKEIPFLIVIDHDGNFINLQDTRKSVKIPLGMDKKTNKPKEKTILVANTYQLPRSVPRSGSRSYETTFLLWDHVGYVLKHPETDEKAPKQHQTWLDALNSLPDTLKNDKGVSAILKFYEKDGINKVKKHVNWKDCEKIKACNVTFILVDDPSPIPCCDAVKNYIQEQSEMNSDDGEKGVCIVTGQKDLIARIFSGVNFGGNIAKLVSFQKNSGYDSYGKEQGDNAPIGKKTEAAYTTALKCLLESEQKVSINTTTFLFWAETPDEYEGYIVDSFKDDPDKRTKAVTALLNSPKTGAYVENQSKKRFFVLGISPNKARISIRYWIVDTVKNIGRRIASHFEATEIVKHPDQPKYLSLFRLLVSTTLQGKPENIPPNLGGEVMRSILEDLPYPVTLLNAAIRRNQAEQQVTYPRAAIIKACLNKSINTQPDYKELEMSLDKENKNVGYLLGRLFAILLSAQKTAETGGDKIADIKDKFYGSASSTPSIVFPTLMRKLQNHLSKIAKMDNKKKLAGYYEKNIREIIDKISGKENEAVFPDNLSLEKQGCFAIGYYHQMCYKKEKESVTTEAE